MKEILDYASQEGATLQDVSMIDCGMLEMLASSIEYAEREYEFDEVSALTDAFYKKLRDIVAEDFLEDLQRLLYASQLYEEEFTFLEA